MQVFIRAGRYQKGRRYGIFKYHSITVLYLNYGWGNHKNLINKTGIAN